MSRSIWAGERVSSGGRGDAVSRLRLDDGDEAAAASVSGDTVPRDAVFRLSLEPAFFLEGKDAADGVSASVVRKVGEERKRSAAKPHAIVFLVLVLVDILSRPVLLFILLWLPNREDACFMVSFKGECGNE